MNLSGKTVLLERLCENFPNNRRRSLVNFEEAEDLRKEINNLEARIQDLYLENKGLIRKM